MASIDQELVFRRERTILETVRKSSPVLVWSGTLGIVILAPNKSRVQDRVYKIIDRMALAMRGTIPASTALARTIIGKAYADSIQLSRGGVGVRELAANAGSVIAGCFYDVLHAPLPVEAAIVQLNDEASKDYLAHVGPTGTLQTFERIHLLATPETHGQGSTDEEDAVEQLREAVSGQWRDHTTMRTLLEDIQNQSALEPFLNRGVRLEVALLDRTALRERKFSEIFKRTDL